MRERVQSVAAPAIAVAEPAAGWTVERRELVLFAAATLAAWAHTADEMRIGELVAVPFGALNVALVGAWPRMRSGWRALTSIVFGLFWGLAVIPYHVLPLLGGAMTWQNVSGLSRVVAGTLMVALGIAILRRRGNASRDMTDDTEAR